MAKTLITKYRPKKFDDVIGQPAAVKALERAIKDGTSQTFLLTGPSGVGKTTLARIAAKAAGAEKGDTFLHNGVVNTGVEDMRGLLELINYRPSHGEASAIIIDEFHGLSKQAMNAILDATEEPPEWLYWFICTTEPTKVPAAIKTRCVGLHLKPVKDEALEELIVKVARAEKFKTNTDIMALCVEAALGSPRQLLTNLAVVQGCKSTEEAREALASAQESGEAVDLAKMLVGGKGSFKQAQNIIKVLRETNQNPENVRVLICRYVTAVALNADGHFLQKQLAVLEEFGEPFNPQDGLAPLVVRCARLML